MKKEIITIVMLSCMINFSLQLQTRQHAYYSYQNPYYYQDAKTYSQPANDVAGIAVAIIIIIVLGIIIGIGVVCYYCCKGIMSRTSNNIEYVGNPPYNPQLAQQQNPNLYLYPQPPLPYRQPVNQPIQAGIPAYPAAPANIPNDRQRLNSPCDSCGVVYKQGQQPRAMLGCQSRHVFHLSCLSQAIRLQTQITCPQCRQKVPWSIKLFCVACKASNVNVNLSQFRSASQGLDLQSINRRYGECCPSCTGL